MVKVAGRKHRKFQTIEDVQKRLGDVPLNRIYSYPAPGTATLEDLLDSSITGDRLVELVDGILVEKAMGYRQGLLGAWLIQLLGPYLRENDIGGLAGSDGMIRFKLNLIRMPDVSFIRWDSVDDPEHIVNPAGACLEYPPDLAVEILSPSNSRGEMAIKLEEYARAGVKLVWYIDPQREEIDVYHKGKLTSKVTIGIDDILDGGAVLPGLQLPVKTIFGRRPPKKYRKNAK